MQNRQVFKYAPTRLVFKFTPLEEKKVTEPDGIFYVMVERGHMHISEYRPEDLPFINPSLIPLVFENVWRIKKGMFEEEYGIILGETMHIFTIY